MQGTFFGYIKSPLNMSATTKCLFNKKSKEISLKCNDHFRLSPDAYRITSNEDLVSCVQFLFCHRRGISLNVVVYFGENLPFSSDCLIMVSQCLQDNLSNNAKQMPLINHHSLRGFFEKNPIILIRFSESLRFYSTDLATSAACRKCRLATALIKLASTFFHLPERLYYQYEGLIVILRNTFVSRLTIRAVKKC